MNHKIRFTHRWDKQSAAWIETTARPDDFVRVVLAAGEAQVGTPAHVFRATTKGGIVYLFKGEITKL